MNERRLAIEKTKKEEEFMMAVVGRNSEAVKDFLEAGVSKSDALEIALRNGLTDLASLLLQSMEHGHSYDLLNATDSAAWSGDFEAVKAVLSKISDALDRHLAGCQAFRISLSSDHPTLCKELLKSTQVSFEFALEEVAKFKDLELVSWLLHNDKGGSIDTKCLNKALHCAIIPVDVCYEVKLSRWIAVVQVLLEHGAEVNSNHEIWGSALRHAAANGEPEIVELLIRHGADVNAQGPFGGSSPLMVAISAGDLTTMRVLMEHGGSIQNLNGIAGNGLQTASFLGFETVVKELLDRGADIDAHLEPWGTPLMLALQGNHPSVAKLLLSRGANVKLNNPECGTALHLAAVLGMEEITKSLVGAGADINAKGGVYFTPLQAAIARGHRIIALFLLDHGADVHIQGGLRGNALQAAQDTSDGLMIKLLLLSGAKATKPISPSLLS